jgi:hypothetical protein
MTAHIYGENANVSTARMLTFGLKTETLQPDFMIERGSIATCRRENKRDR